MRVLAGDIGGTYDRTLAARHALQRYAAILGLDDGPALRIERQTNGVRGVAGEIPTADLAVQLTGLGMRSVLVAGTTITAAMMYDAVTGTAR